MKALRSYNLDANEITTILEALRLYQRHLDAGGERLFDKGEVLEAGEIDALCESINCAESVTVNSA